MIFDTYFDLCLCATFHDLTEHFPIFGLWKVLTMENWLMTS